MYLQLPTTEQKESALKEFNATQETVQEDVQLLIDWMSKQPHLPQITDEELLSHCLLMCKNSVEKTKQRLEMYFNTKAIMPEIFKNRDPFSKEIERVCSVGMYVPLPKLTPDGYRVIILYISDNVKNLELSPYNHFLKATLMTVDIMGKIDTPRGIIVVHDGKNMTMNFVAAAATEIHKQILLTAKSLPVRYRNLYFFNMSPAAEIFLSIGKNLIKKELANRIEILKSETDLCKVLPKEILPRNYGGNELHLKELKDLWYEEIKTYKKFLLDTENFVSDLSKKPSSFPFSDVYGISGTFRRLSVD